VQAPERATGARAVYKSYKSQLKKLKKNHWDLNDPTVCEYCGMIKKRAVRDIQLWEWAAGHLINITSFEVLLSLRLDCWLYAVVMCLSRLSPISKSVFHSLIELSVLQIRGSDLQYSAGYWLSLNPNNQDFDFVVRSNVSFSDSPQSVSLEHSSLAERLVNLSDSR